MTSTEDLLQVSIDSDANPFFANNNDESQTKNMVDEVPHEWKDVTELFRQARTQMKIGEMIHCKNFTLYSAMSAIELMDPKMDVGYGNVKDLMEIELPLTLSSKQIINIMDQLFAYEMSWLDSHTLVQTVFSCVYTQRLSEIHRVDLFYFLRLQLATMNCIFDLLSEEKIAMDEEDFVNWTFGFKLPQMDSKLLNDNEANELNKILNSIIKYLNNNHSNHAQSDELNHSIILRIKFRMLYYQTFRCLNGHYTNKSPFDAILYIEQLIEIIDEWIKCPFKSDIDQDLINTVFDVSINRHLMTSTPPRTAPLMDITSALDYMRSKLLVEIQSLLSLRQYALPPDTIKQSTATNKFPSDDSNSSNNSLPRYSLHVAIHAIESFCANHKPTVLTRALMSRLTLMIPNRSTFMFDNEGASFINMILTDMGLHERHLDLKNKDNFIISENINFMRESIIHIFQSFCKNRSRQRQQLLLVLRWWDQNTYIAIHDEENENKKNDTSNQYLDLQNDNSNNDDTNNEEYSQNERKESSRRVIENKLENKTPFQLISYEICCRLMIQHWLLGFECELYHDFEYATMFFYIGYILNELINATTTLGQFGIEGASLHPIRYALYIMDDAKLFLCRALYLLLDALSNGDHWEYTCNRNEIPKNKNKKLFGSEELWYEQRFGVVMNLIYGPPYLNYKSYKKSIQFQHQQQLQHLQYNSNDDLILIKLRQASTNFLNARKKLESCKKFLQTCSSRQNMLLDELLKLGAVAVENSLTSTQLIRDYLHQKTLPRDSRKDYSVQFLFKRHHHFPVVKAIEKT